MVRLAQQTADECGDGKEESNGSLDWYRREYGMVRMAQTKAIGCGDGRGEDSSGW